MTQYERAKQIATEFIFAMRAEGVSVDEIDVEELIEEVEMEMLFYDDE